MGAELGKLVDDLIAAADVYRARFGRYPPRLQLGSYFDLDGDVPRMLHEVDQPLEG